MSFLANLTALLSSKGAATAAAAVLAAGGISVASQNADERAADALAEAAERSEQGEEADDDLDVEQVVTEVPEPQDVDLAVEDDDLEDGEDADDGNETSERVHAALVGGGDERPGDEDFGPTVAQNAQDGGADFGQRVASAARGDDDDNDDDDVEVEARRSPSGASDNPGRGGR